MSVANTVGSRPQNAIRRQFCVTDVIVRHTMIDGQISSVVSLMADQLQNVTFRIFEEHRAGVECGEIGKG